MPADTNTLTGTNYTTVLILAVLLAIIAAIPRLYNLGELSFYMDEETTSFASRSMAEGMTPQMPGGMPYHRSLPHSWMNSISARLLGLDDEISYRLPGAILGLITAPLIFLLARPFVGTHVAFLAAVLLALSEWHIIVSRQARMYAPFVFFYTACVFSILRWARDDQPKYLILSVLLIFLTATLHSLGVFAAFVPLTALFIKGFAKTSHYKLIAFAIVAGVTSYIYSLVFIQAPYQEWIDAHGIISRESSSASDLMRNLTVNTLLIAQGIVGIILGVWLGICSRFPDDENGKEFRLASRYILAILAGCLSATGHIHGALIAVLLLTALYPDSLIDYLKQVYKPLAVISGIATMVSIVTITQHGFTSGIKLLLTFPYPNWVVLNTISPGITLLFLSGMLYLAIAKKRTTNHNIMVLMICALLPIIIVGIFKKWAPARYMLEAYPFMLIVASFALYSSVNTLFHRIQPGKLAPGFIFAGVVILSGILGGHGLIHAYRAGAVQHGDTLNKAALVFDVYPDHKFPGQYVATHRRPGDIVIAEDALVQRWYAGKIDYWLRNHKTHMRFLYKDDRQLLHDIYVNSIVATPEVLDSLEDIKDRRIWVITTSETMDMRPHYLSKEQVKWLSDIENTQKPLFTGEDGITKVYCLNHESSNYMQADIPPS
jgi:4-amino-4-deoxy-L-arabinose transferase-like glycosyltransferase